MWISFVCFLGLLDVTVNDTWDQEMKQPRKPDKWSGKGLLHHISKSETHQKIEILLDIADS